MIDADVVFTAVIHQPTIVVKGNVTEIRAGGHGRLHDFDMGVRFAACRDRIAVFDSVGDPGSSVVRRAWDPDDEWSDSEARDRARRYWPFASELVRSWISGFAARPATLLLGVPAPRRTMVRYAWEIDPDGEWEYFPHYESGPRWGIPLGRRLPAHPACGKVLVEDRGGRRVQVLLNHISGCRVLDPSPGSDFDRIDR